MLTDEQRADGEWHALLVDIGFIQVIQHAIQGRDIAVFVADDGEVEARSIGREGVDVFYPAGMRGDVVDGKANELGEGVSSAKGEEVGGGGGRGKGVKGRTSTHLHAPRLEVRVRQRHRRELGGAHWRLASSAGFLLVFRLSWEIQSLLPFRSCRWSGYSRSHQGERRGWPTNLRCSRGTTQ